jgi:hypothetical protein
VVGGGFLLTTAPTKGAALRIKIKTVLTFLEMERTGIEEHLKNFF